MFNPPLSVIGKQKLSGVAASVTFTLADYTIPAGTRHLAVIWNGGKTATQDMALLRFNNDSGANYNDQRLSGASTTASAARATGATSIQLGHTPTGANLFGGGMFLIPHYAGAVNHKAILAVGGAVENRIDVLAGRWADASAITRIDILATSSTFVANSIFLLCAVDERYLVEEQLLAADGTVTFSSIPQLDGDLCAIGFVRTDGALALENINLTINGDTTEANYARQRLSGAATVADAAAAADREFIYQMPAANAVANAFGAFVISISQHANGVKQPHILTVSGSHESTGPYSFITVMSGRRANIAAVTSLAFAPGEGGTNLKSGSLISLYHVPKRLVDYDKLTVDAASVTHEVPSGLEALVESVFVRSDRGIAIDGLDVSFNNDVTAANYDSQILQGNGAVVSASQSAAARALGEIPAATAPANVFGGGVVLIPAHAETDRHKHFLTIVGPSDDYIDIHSMRWESLTAITEIDLTPGTGPNFEGD